MRLSHLALCWLLVGCPATSPPEDLDLCRDPADCLLVQRDGCGGPSTCAEDLRAMTTASWARLKARQENKECEPRKRTPCTPSDRPAFATCKAGRCVVESPRTDAGELARAWRVVAWHRGDSVSRDPRSSIRVVFTAGGVVTWSGESTLEKSTTAGVQPVTTTWSATGRWSRVGETLDIVWDELSEPAASHLDTWTQLTKGRSTIGITERPAKLWLQRQDVERSIELEAVVP